MSENENRREEKILVVDDNKLNLKLVELILQRDGYATISVSDSCQVLAIARNIVPDLILLDIEMPVLSGIEVCRQLKESSELKEIPVIFVTGNTDNETIKKAFAVGCHDYVRKPVNEVELLTRMHAVSAQIELNERLKDEEKLNGIFELAGTVCHEFNQPLQIISGSAELLLMDLPVSGPGYDLASTIVEQSQRLGDINRKLMKITRYEKKRYIGESSILDLDKAAAE